MEQQKLLWTILAVGILVLILLGAGMFFFLPSDSTGLAQNGKTTEWSKAAAPAPAAEQKTPDTKAAAPKTAQAPKPEIKKTPVQTPQTPAAKPAPQAKPAQPSQPAQTKPATPAPKATPAPATKPATTSQQQTKPATTQAPAAKPAQTQQTKPAATTSAAKGSYWVQVGSYATRDAADKIKQDLTAKGYTSSIQSITANGKTYHRVKIGPYATRAEVDSMLPKIKAIPGMGDSFITTK